MAKRRRSTPRKSLDKVSQKSDTSRSRVDVDLRFFLESSGSVPFRLFYQDLPDIDKAKIRAAMERLSTAGHMLRPPLNEHLGDQLFYLRIQATGGTYRIFYWPFGRGIVILGQGFSKKTRTCPPNEIMRALKYRENFLSNPAEHTYKGEIDDFDE